MNSLNLEKLDKVNSSVILSGNSFAFFFGFAFFKSRFFGG